MKQISIISFWFLLICHLPGKIVVWTTDGSVTNLTGSFADQGISVDDALSFRMTYDDEAPEQRFRSFPTFGIADSDYRDNINLTIEVRIGDRLWAGQVTSGTEFTPRTILVKRREGASAESLEASLTIEDGAIFRLFPLDADDENDSIVITFSGTADFIGDGIDTDSFNRDEITMATGLLKSGATGNQLGFRLNLEDLVIIDEERIPVAPPTAILARESQFEFSFISNPLFNYEIQTSRTIGSESWLGTEEGIIAGTGAPISRTFVRDNDRRFFRVLVTAKE